MWWKSKRRERQLILSLSLGILNNGVILNRKKVVWKENQVCWLGFVCVCRGWGNRAEMNFILGHFKFNMIELPFVNFPHKPEAWKRYQGWNVNWEPSTSGGSNRSLHLKEKEKDRTCSLLNLQPFFSKWGWLQGVEVVGTLSDIDCTLDKLWIWYFVYIISFYSPPRSPVRKGLFPHFTSLREVD